MKKRKSYNVQLHHPKQNDFRASSFVTCSHVSVFFFRISLLSNLLFDVRSDRTLRMKEKGKSDAIALASFMCMQCQ